MRQSAENGGDPILDFISDPRIAAHVLAGRRLFRQISAKRRKGKNRRGGTVHRNRDSPRKK